MNLGLLGQIAVMVTQNHSKQLLTYQDDHDHVCPVFSGNVDMFFDKLLVEIIETPIDCLSESLIEMMRSIDLVNFTVLPQCLHQVLLDEFPAVVVVTDSGLHLKLLLYDCVYRYILHIRDVSELLEQHSLALSDREVNMPEILS